MLVNWAIENTACWLCAGWIPSKLNYPSERERTKTNTSAFEAPTRWTEMHQRANLMRL